MTDLNVADLPLVNKSGSVLPTPYYLYDFDVLGRRIDRLSERFAGLFEPSYAIKSNPNRAVLAEIMGRLQHIDASSAHEVERALSIGVPADNISWSGPGKRKSELQALSGRGILIVVESEDEIELLCEVMASKGGVQDIALRINPDHVPKGFGASMSGKPSQFGVDEPKVPDAIAKIKSCEHLQLVGFHAYTGSMCLKPEPIAENIKNLCGIFRNAVSIAGIVPKVLIFGAGFGIPLHEGQEHLDIDAVQGQVRPFIQELADDPVMGQARRLLEIGRWIVGPSGALVTSVLSSKISRELRIAVCDAGFNNHLAACGMMGSVFQKNYPIIPIFRSGDASADPVDQMLAGPLCTSIDQLSRKISLPPLMRDDVIAILMSGAYGLTASPTRFISHAEPAEYAWNGKELVDISESALNKLGSLVSEIIA